MIWPRWLRTMPSLACVAAVSLFSMLITMRQELCGCEFDLVRLQGGRFVYTSSAVSNKVIVLSR